MSVEFVVAVIGFVVLILAWAVLPIRHAAPLSEVEELPEPAVATPMRNEAVRMRRGEEALV
ncbi:MAG: hypothetical protein HY677_04035 [Chloroflexi bacterium]|nr:hypothetical protein [Chloroflexota bacterium]